MVDGTSDKDQKKETRLTEAQEAVLQFIEGRCRETGMPPSYREIQEHFGYKAVGSVQDHVRALQRKGFLEERMKVKGRQPRRTARNLLPSSLSSIEAVRRVPVYGEISAGSTRDAAQIELGTVVVAESVTKAPCFALRVIGDSMIEAGIFEGDFLIVEKMERATAGDIVVALVQGETTVKRYVERADGPYLEPANARLKATALKNVAQWSIQGKVVGLQRVLR